MIEKRKIKCKCGKEFENEVAFKQHLSEHKVSFLTTKKIPKRINVDFTTHGRIEK